MKPTLLKQETKIATSVSLQKALLYCGIVSSPWYFIINIIIPLRYPGYSVTSQTVSELSAIDTPTRTLWMIFCSLYTLLMIAFGFGVWLSANSSKKLRFVGAVIIFDAIFGAFWPPMHQRDVIAAGNATLTDTLHLVWTYVHIFLVLLMIIFGAMAVAKKFQIYSIVTIMIFIVFGILTTKESIGIETGKPTPYVGIWERVNMAAYMIWIIAFATSLIRKPKSHPPGK